MKFITLTKLIQKLIFVKFKELKNKKTFQKFQFRECLLPTIHRVIFGLPSYLDHSQINEKWQASSQEAPQRTKPMVPGTPTHLPQTPPVLDRAWGMRYPTLMGSGMVSCTVANFSKQDGRYSIYKSWWFVAVGGRRHYFSGIPFLKIFFSFMNEYPKITHFFVGVLIHEYVLVIHRFPAGWNISPNKWLGWFGKLFSIRNVEEWWWQRMTMSMLPS